MNAEHALMIAGRTLLAALFVLAGLAKIAGPQPFLEHMAQHRLPGFLLYGVITLELGAGLALFAGFQVRYAALALGLFCAMTALIFHLDLSDKVERSFFVKDLAIAGGMFVLASIDWAAAR